MATRTERIEARLAPEQAASIEKAAELEGVSKSTFLVSSAVARAEEILASHRVTVVPTEFFDLLLEKLEEPPAVIPSLARAAKRARKPAR